MYENLLDCTTTTAGPNKNDEMKQILRVPRCRLFSKRERDVMTNHCQLFRMAKPYVQGKMYSFTLSKSDR